MHTNKKLHKGVAACAGNDKHGQISERKKRWFMGRGCGSQEVLSATVKVTAEATENNKINNLQLNYVQIWVKAAVDCCWQQQRANKSCSTLQFDEYSNNILEPLGVYNLCRIGFGVPRVSPWEKVGNRSVTFTYLVQFLNFSGFE